MNPLYFRDVLKSWKNRDILLFKQYIHRLPAKQVRNVVRVLEKKSSKLLESQNIEYAKILLEWIKVNHKKYALNWDLIEKKIIFNQLTPCVKEKNILYLQLCELFLDSKYLYKLPAAFSEFWPEGWSYFTKNNLDKMPDKIKRDYLIKSFIYITPELNKSIVELITHDGISQTLALQANKMGESFFWASDTPQFQRFTDTQTLYLLQWSESFGFKIKPQMNIYDYCNDNWEKTFSYLTKELGSAFIRGRVLPELIIRKPEQCGLFNTWLNYYGLEHTLEKTIKKNKVIKI